MQHILCAEHGRACGEHPVLMSTYRARLSTRTHLAGNLMLFTCLSMEINTNNSPPRTDSFTSISVHLVGVSCLRVGLPILRESRCSHSPKHLFLENCGFVPREGMRKWRSRSTPNPHLHFSILKLLSSSSHSHGPGSSTLTPARALPQMHWEVQLLWS